ncbi:MAG: phosphonate ABC transporter ATP-binding protein [Acidaminococcus sp.]|jgi:phosphonate transport system ATP-binding protein|nr:phosphonate ABC transporter ATP-binding protein [Acidaminococcus sp.]MCI2099859.1 phosphonate ABC transporter ATP-binding protein [Acidaminococcus sp.]MCI2114090.1 phosphonate ABC transporter ATP-binding protein [Acidaminococcus sp.]MCI2116030.1 phosphonate ABC transporter ATP-binding protein [Acidaminococcus sp.]
MLELRHVYHKYKDKDILQDISFVIPEGQFVSVIGPSGAGKTTLLRLFNHMTKPRSGEVYVGKERIDTLHGAKLRKVQQRVGMIYQDFCLVEELSCVENVLNGCLARIPFWRALSGRFPENERTAAQKALQEVHLETYADQPVYALSGGQKQRVAIARTLLQDADILLADEPVASLDPLTAEQILGLLRQLQQVSGMTILMSSHNVEQARKWSDRILGLKDGKLFFDGPPEAWTHERLAALYGSRLS